MDGWLNPGEQFIIDYQIPNLADSGTYYVKAIITNQKTGNVIDTLTLVSQGSGYFSKTWNVPQDGSGQGFWISVIRTVYDDALFTSPSQTYGALRSKYLIQNRVLSAPGAWGGLDYGNVKEIIEKQLASVLPGLETRLTESVRAITRAIPSFEPLLTKIQELSSYIEDDDDDEQINLLSDNLTARIESLESEVKKVIAAVDSSSDTVGTGGVELIKAIHEMSQKTEALNSIVEKIASMQKSSDELFKTAIAELESRIENITIKPVELRMGINKAVPTRTEKTVAQLLGQ